MLLIIAIATDLVSIGVLAGALYFRRHRRRDLLLSYVSLNVGVLAVTLVLGSVEAGIGLGLGLFGVLSILRLRSDQITQQEIAYYFTSLALGLVAGLHPGQWWITPALSALMVATMAVLDHPRVGGRTLRCEVTLDAAYPDPAERDAAIERLFGARVLKAEVLRLDLVQDVTVVDARYVVRRDADPLRHTDVDARGRDRSFA